jgi:hypothetical protein
METTQALDTRRPDFSAVLARAAELDLTRPLAFAALGVVYLLVRLPFLNYGYGTDPDAWRVALTGQYLIEHGQYFPSRLPGNPLHEFVIAPFVPIGWVATNFVTALASLAGVYLFAAIVSHLRVPNAAIITVGFAFTPLLFINSIATMDYMWALTFALAAYYATLKGAPVWTGVFIGLAMGFRLQTAIVGLPLAYLMWREGHLRQVVPVSLAAGAVALLAFTPVLVTYGVTFMNYYDEAVGYQTVIRLLGKEALGVAGGVAVLVGAALSWRRLRELPSDVRRDVQVTVWALLIFLYFFSFLRLPHEIAYLIPVFPFGYLIMARYFSRPVLAGVVAVVLAAGIVDLTTPGDGLVSPGDLAGARPGKGLVLSNVQTMENQRLFVEDVVTSDVPPHSVVMAGFVYPQLAMRERGRLDIGIIEKDYAAISMISDRGEAVDRERDVRYVWLLTYDAFLALKSQGYQFFVVPDAVGGTSHLYDYRPQLFGATFLELDRASPSAGPGTASTDR